MKWKTKLNYISTVNTLCRYQCTTVGRVGNYVWQGGQTENQGGETKKNCLRFAPNFIKQMFANPGLKACSRPRSTPYTSPNLPTCPTIELN